MVVDNEVGLLYKNKCHTPNRSYFTFRLVLNKMAVLYLVIIVLGLAYESLSNFNNADLISKMIEEQRRKCPYISLCNTPNISVFKGNTNGPCCKVCSCNDTCVEDGSCCPDYFTKDTTTKSEQPNESTTELVATTKVKDRKECVKIQHGRIQNQKGFMMVATCPSSYDDIDVKRKCEMKFDYHLPFDLFDHVPITDTDRPREIYKNRHCGQCNMPKDSSPTFWHILLTCESSYFYLNVSPVNDLSTFIEAVLNSGKTCNIVFEYETTSMSDNPTICVYDSLIDTCNDDTSNDDLQTSCKQYTWPIEAYVHPERRLYKNYACMLCNGINFKETCRKFTDVKTFTVQFMPTFNGTQTSTTSSKTSRADQQIINRFFPNTEGEVHCKMGFVYDVRKRICRLVLCPQYFVVSDGECVPLFRNLLGVDYSMLLQADVTSSEELEVADLTKSFYNLFHEHLGDDLIEFSIWRDQILSVKDRYFVEIYVHGNFSRGKYIAILNFTNNIIQRMLPFNENSSVVFSFNITTALDRRGRKLLQLGNDMFFIIDSYKRNGKGVSDGLGKLLYISPVLLCYRISLSENEIEDIYFQYTSIFNRNIHNHNIQVVKEKGLVYIVCLEQGLENVADTINVFLRDESTNYTFIAKQKVNERRNKKPKTTTVENENGDLNKSLVATFATVAFIAFIVILRRVMKRCVREQIDTNVAEYVNERNVEITESQCENSNKEDAIVTRKDMPPTIEVP